MPRFTAASAFRHDPPGTTAVLVVQLGTPQAPEPGPGPEIPGGTPAEAPGDTPTEIPVEAPGLPGSTPTGPANPVA